MLLLEAHVYLSLKKKINLTFKILSIWKAIDSYRLNLYLFDIKWGKTSFHIIINYIFSSFYTKIPCVCPYHEP